jgi:glycosyltransferase involved in cell wall biosynthesis/predicted AlkP superfamily pyrophosphatase or phosphodiesterase
LKKTTLVILVDCLRHDYVNKNDSPFLYFLAEKGIKGNLIESFGFQQLPAIFAGLHPEGSESGHALYVYDPDNSPFKDIQELKFKKTSENEPSKALFKEYLTAEVRKLERFKGHSASARYGYPAEIPYEMLPNFAFSEKINIFEPDSLPAPTLFDILRQHNMAWLWIAYPTDDQRTVAILDSFKKRIKPEHSLVYLHFAELDWAGHAHGPDSQERRKIQREIDSAVKEIYEIMEGRSNEVNCLIFGDHGMVEITKTIDIESQLKSSGLKVPEDLVYFLDSTQARFWFKNEHAKKVVEEILGRFSDSGRILNDDDLARLHIRYDHKKFGELFFAVNESVMIYPNFFQRTGASRGMHGYLPEVKDNQAAFIVAGCGPQKKPEDAIDMVDLFPMILDLMGLPVPQTSMGKSLLNIAPARNISDHAQIKDMQERRFVSVIIPTYNRKEVLERTLRAYSDQTYREDKFEVIVIDDGSTDGTGQTVRSLVDGSNYKLRYFRQDNKGPAAARNLGIKEAAGEIVLITGDDCIPDSKLIEEHVRYHDLNAGENVGILGFTGLHPEIEETPFLEYIYQGPQFSYHTLKNGCEVPFGNFYTSNISMSKQKLIDIGLFDEDFKYAAWEDIELGYRLFKSGFKLIYDQNAITCHHHESTLQNFMERQIKVGEAAIIFYKKHPELKELVGIDHLADPNFRNHFYGAILHYYSLLGMEKGLRNGLKNNDEKIVQLAEGLEAKKSKYQFYIETSLQEKSRHINELTNAVQVRDAQITELKSALQSMQESIVWRLLTWYHKNVVERALPQGTRRKKLYDSALNGGRNIVNKGWRGFL